MFSSIHKRNFFSVSTFLLLSIAILLFFYFTSPPKGFVSNTEINFEKGQTVSSLSETLVSENIVKSALVFKVLVRISGQENDIESGVYIFENPQSVFLVVKRFISADFGLHRVRFVIPEGTTTADIAKKCADLLKYCNQENFIKLSLDKNGMLFPDTYFFFETDNETVVVDTMYKNFQTKTETIFSELNKERINEILVLASILEGETNSGDERAIVSGILNNRISIGMPLQIDASFYVYLGKTSSQLTLSDLRIDEPWNTYVYKGLPSDPIANPGLETIQAAMNPIKTSYLYYLHGSDGTIHYAKTFEEHKINKSKYLN